MNNFRESEMVPFFIVTKLQEILHLPAEISTCNSRPKMFKYRILTLTLFTQMLFHFSCEKCELDPSNVTTKSVLLEIDENAKSYVDENGNHFYSGAFKSIQDTLLFKLPMKAGAKYQIYCSRSEPVYDVEMYLLNSELDTISKALFYPPYLTEIFFLPVTTDDYYVGLKLDDSYNQDLRYKLYFEKCEEKNYSFSEKNWEGRGHWQNINKQTIKYNGSKSQNIKWLRLIQVLKSNSKISFTVRTENNTIPSVGFAFAYNYELIDNGVFQEKLPANGSYFNFNDTTTFRMVYARDGLANGYISATLNTNDVNPKRGIKFEIVKVGFSNHQVYINNKPLDYTLATKNYKHFYLVIEDISKSDVYFEDFKIEEI